MPNSQYRYCFWLIWYRFFGLRPQNDIKLFCRKYPVYKFALFDSTLPKICQNDKKDLVILSVAKYLFCEAKGSPQEPSSFLSCWGTRYSFPSCKNIHRMFLLRQSLIEKRYLSRVRNGQGGEPCREDTFIAKVSRRKERIMGTKITNSSNIFYFIWYFWQQKYHKTARRQLRDLF